jgi:hypothetical protein
MSDGLPRLLSDAIATGVWRNPGSPSVTAILGAQLDLPEMELFETRDVMLAVARQVAGGLVDNPEFCMVRHQADLGIDDHRLVCDRAIFVAGSTTPGDDVLAALDVRDEDEDPPVVVLDWRMPIPRRWVLVGKLSELLQRLIRTDRR